MAEPHPVTPADAAPRRPERRRRILRGLLIATALYLAPVMVGCMNLSTPVDYLINVGSLAHEPGLEAPHDGKRRLVILQHGIFRSAGALWKLERALRDHGYETLNVSYPSTRGRLEDHAAMLRVTIERHRKGPAAPPFETYYVGHSMGGLVIRSYLSGTPAYPPTACVFVATPHRGAVLTDKRKDWLLFKVFMGDEAALQLSPGAPFYARLQRLDCPCGVVYGGPADGEGYNDDIPGADDGTVAVAEAQLPEAIDSIRLPHGHTGLSFRDASLRQVLHFLKHRVFDRGQSP
jgi:pimeloyl-ACP methyl ester carboxylesterase